MNFNNNEHVLFTGTAHPAFANLVAKHLGIQLASAEVGKFANGEIKVIINQSVRKKDCFIIQPTGSSNENSPNDNLMELFILIDALKRGSAKTVTVIMPYYGYERQDRKDYSRAPISATIIANFLETLNTDRLIVFDLHAGQIQGFFSNKIPVDNLYVESYFIKYIKDTILSSIVIDNIVIVAPDEGAVKRAVRISSQLNCGAATIFKERSKPGVVDKMTLMGDVKDKVAIIVDDIIDTAGTACKAAETLNKFGATDVYIIACHGLLSNPAISRIDNSYFKKVIITNTTPLPIEAKMTSKIEVIDVSWLCAEAILRQIRGKSLKELYF